MEIVLDKRKIEYGIERLIEKQLRIMEEVNTKNAYTREECEKRLALIRQRDEIEFILHYLFDLQTFQYCCRADETIIDVVIK